MDGLIALDFFYQIVLVLKMIMKLFYHIAILIYLMTSY